MRSGPGHTSPLGAHWDGQGVNFALFSRAALAVELCVFEGGREVRVAMSRGDDADVWTVYLPDARPGLRYGFRVDGPHAPLEGKRFNPAKLLLDPYAKAMDEVAWDDSLFGYVLGHGELDLTRDSRDSGPFAPKCTVVADAFDWAGDRPPRTPLERTLVYECHVRGMTALHPDVPAELRGTYTGLSSPALLKHLTSLGVTAVELLPVHHFLDTRHLVERGLRNYWGYDTLGYFAPARRYAAQDPVLEFKTMVRDLHRAGIEVWLDVVYNHTAEGDQLGPTLSLRGIDNAAYFRLQDDPRYYVNYTGCGNTLDVREPRVLDLIVDSLRYWAGEMHVDGFRFDLAPVLARGSDGFDAAAPFFERLRRDPLLSKVKLIAEPWDVGPAGYQFGRFPREWSEWNDDFRDTVRCFWRGDEGQVPRLASRLSGSSDVFGPSGRGPQASVNFITCHDGFTLQDLVSYERKHNDKNGEDGRDGHDANHSRNWGVEGPSDKPRVVNARERAKRGLMATLALSQGVPMLSHGDELGRSQGGNNNAYCQDDETTWIDWELDERDLAFLLFTRQVFALRRESALFAATEYLTGDSPEEGSARDVVWLAEDGAELCDATWNEPKRRVFGRLLAGKRPRLLILNGGARNVDFSLPAGRAWREALHTAQGSPERRVHEGTLPVPPHTLVLLEEEAR